MKALLVIALLRLNALLPLSLNHALGVLLSRFINSEQRHDARINIKKCFPERSDLEQEALFQKTLAETGKTFTEFGALWYKDRTAIFKLIKEITGEEAVKEALKKGKGVILAAPHLGNWEMVNLYCSNHYPLTSLYRPPRVTALDNTIRNARQRFGATLVPTDTKGVRSLYQALSRNEIVMILPDQDPRDSGGHFAPFFGIEANTMTLLSRLAQKTGGQVFCCYAERLADSRGFNIHFETAPEGIYNKDMRTSVHALNQLIESSVRRHPAQYQWGYKRFRTRPNTESDFYANDE